MAGFDAHKNLAISAVVTAPTPATSGTSLSVTAGEGQRFPAAPFNATVWPASAMPTPLNGEVIRVTARATDALTITRAQEGSTARAIGTGDLIAATITAKTLTDLETRAALKDEINTFTANEQIIHTGYPRVTLRDSFAPATAQRFDMLNISSTLQFRALTDDGGAVVANPLVLGRGGDVTAGRNLFEAGRTVPLGHWVDVPFTGANFTASAGLTWAVSAGNQIFNRYTVVGKTLHWLVYIEGSSLSGTPGPQLYVAFPPGLVGVYRRGVAATTQIYDGTSNRGWVRVASNNAALIIEKDPSTNFSIPGPVYVEFSITLEIN